MPYFLSDALLTSGQTAVLTGAEATHLLQSRRIRIGERFVVQDPKGQRFQAELTATGRGRAEARVLDSVPVPEPPAVQVTLLQAAVKEKATEWIIQKSTELGVAELIFFPTTNTTIPERQLGSEKTRERWNRIAWEACKQSDRQAPPSIGVSQGLGIALEHSRQAATGWVLELDQGIPPDTARQKTGLPSAIRLLVGPEGGLTPQEVAQAKQAGLIPVRLGYTILRAETAALAGLSLLLLGE